MDQKRELSLDEMDRVSGGTGGSPRCLPGKDGFKVYRIQRGDTLDKIARRFQTTEDYLKSNNATIHDVKDITVGYYIYVPE